MRYPIRFHLPMTCQERRKLRALAKRLNMSQAALAREALRVLFAQTKERR